MILFLLRHGDVSPFAADDASRTLTELGERQAVIGGAFLANLEQPPALIISSPLTRARQTAEILASVLKIRETFVSEYLVPESNPRNISAELNEKKDDSIVLVGHEPQLRAFSSLLLSGSTTSEIAFGKGSMACIEIRLPIAFGKGILQWLMTNEQMSKTAIGREGGK